MRLLLVSLAVLSFAIPTPQADPNDLSGGVLITHAPDDFSISRYWPDACYEYDASGWGISSCEEQINTMPILGYPNGETLFYVVAAWHEDKVWCGTEFGIGTEFQGWWYFLDYGPCLVNCLENPTAGWPGPGQGTVVVATDTPWEGNFLPIYFFIGYGYYEDTIPLDVDPATGFVGFGNCEIPAEIWDAVDLGTMGIGVPGVYVCWSCCPEAVCCIGTDCFIMTEEACTDAQGEWHPEYSTCTPNPCDPTPGENASWGSIKTLYR